MKLSLIILMLLFMCRPATGAVGCTLTDPDRDIRRIFPDATGYRTEFITIQERGGREFAQQVEALLGDKLDPVHEPLDVPYAYYTVLKGTNTIGHMHGVNQKGMFGGMQLILATDLQGTIVGFYYQKLTSPDARRFRNPTFTDPFTGLHLDDFLSQDTLPSEEQAQSQLGKITDPSKQSADDFNATLRGIRKNLALLKLFKLTSNTTRETNRKSKK
ncbi:MAG: hypothetical protein ISS35_06480 [Kiritimatiellae bacterium]|nr:hypothetical protein [Kiritimatiellia bacterium]